MINNVCDGVLTSCLEHVINLANVDVMGHITKITAVENATVTDGLSVSIVSKIPYAYAET